MSDPTNPLIDAVDDELTLRSCATQLFKWVRAAGELIEQSPAFLQSVAHDLEQAWRDSAKR